MQMNEEAIFINDKLLKQRWGWFGTEILHLNFKPIGSSWKVCGWFDKALWHDQVLRALLASSCNDLAPLECFAHIGRPATSHWQPLNSLSNKLMSFFGWPYQSIALLSPRTAKFASVKVEHWENCLRNRTPKWTLEESIAWEKKVHYWGWKRTVNILWYGNTIIEDMHYALSNRIQTTNKPYNII